MKILISAIVIFGLNACKQPQPKGNTKTMNFGSFTIEIPHSWQQVKVNGIDSDVGSIAIDNKDTLHFDLGWYSYNLTEGEPWIVERSVVENFQPGVDTSEMIIVESSRYIDPDKYKKQNVSWDSIDGRTAKIVYPRRSGNGFTGVYIDTLWISKSRVVKFNLYGRNLKPENEKVFLNALRTLKFQKN